MSRADSIIKPYDWDDGDERDPELEVLSKTKIKKDAPITSEQRCAVRKADIINLLFHEPKAGSVKSLPGLLSDTSHGFSGPDQVLDNHGRTAMHFFCDPKVHEKMNEAKLERLHSIEVLSDLVHAGCSWHVPDANGDTPWQLAPEWVRNILCAQRKLNENNQENQ